MKKRNFKDSENKLYSIIDNKDMFYSLPDNLKFEIYNYLAIINLQQEKFLNALSYMLYLIMKKPLNMLIKSQR
ncbi:hypothetical protein ACOT5F_05055 [Clostridium perfringens]|uniref:hypothetical protein n=1 Tax=Clostridium perfringens TaxID=1502 RepID=UPI003BA9DC7D